MTFSSQSRSSRRSPGSDASSSACFSLDVHHVAEPVVDEPVPRPFERRRDAAAAVVAADDHVLHGEDVDGVLQHREAVEVGVHDDVGDVAVDEHLARRQADDLVGGDAAVRAADPEVLGRLPGGETGEEVRVGCDHRGRPGAVALEELGEIGHAGRLSAGREGRPAGLPVRTAGTGPAADTRRRASPAVGLNPRLRGRSSPPPRRDAEPRLGAPRRRPAAQRETSA